MFNDKTLSAIHLHTSTALFWDWLLGKVIWRECSMMKHCFSLTSILRQHFYETDWFIAWFVQSVEEGRFFYLLENIHTHCCYNGIVFLWFDNELEIRARYLRVIGRVKRFCFRSHPYLTSCGHSFMITKNAVDKIKVINR